MRRIRRFTAVAALIAAALAAAPSSASAVECTDRYFVCLNNAYADSWWVSHNLKLVECALKYLKCLGFSW